MPPPFVLTALILALVIAPAKFGAAQPTATAPAAPGAAQPPAPRSQEPAPGSVEAAIAPRDYVAAAAAAAAFKVESSELALERTARSDLQSFARQMIEEHTASATQLREAAGEAGIGQLDLPLDPNQADRMQRLAAADDDAFEELYIRMQVDSHERAIALAARFAETAEPGPLRRHAAESLGMLQDHLRRTRGFAY